MADPGAIITGTLGSGFGSIGSYLWIIIVFVLIGIIGAVGYFFNAWRKTREKWNIQIRLRQEDTQNNRIPLDPMLIRGQRKTLSNGIRLIYLEKEVLGKRLLPLLNHYTRPGVYDLVLTADNRIFIITGIEGINEKRKELEVGLRYPGIDNDFDDLNRDFAALNKQDRRSDLLGIVKAASIAVVAIALLIGIIVGGKYWLDAKDRDVQISQAELQLFDNLNNNSRVTLEMINALRLLTEDLKELKGVNNLGSSLNNLNS